MLVIRSLSCLPKDHRTIIIIIYISKAKRIILEAISVNVSVARVPFVARENVLKGKKARNKISLFRMFLLHSTTVHPSNLSL